MQELQVSKILQRSPAMHQYTPLTAALELPRQILIGNRASLATKSRFSNFNSLVSIEVLWALDFTVFGTTMPLLCRR